MQIFLSSVDLFESIRLEMLYGCEVLDIFKIILDELGGVLCGYKYALFTIELSRVIAQIGSSL